ncbi:HAMP domain-containing sensor histidine kinase [Tessaracoccus lubricantis]
MMTAPVIVDGEAVALVFVPDGSTAADRRTRAAVAWTATAVITALALAAAGLLLWVEARILGPFRRLSAFATDVAAGRLDAPLDMDRGNVFGAWSESFDLMRDELADARRREEETNRSKQELVAQIGHDVRTPVASISATAEVLRARTDDPAVGERLDVILTKAGQIRQLMTDLNQANVAPSRALSVVPTEFDAQRLATLVRDSDTAGSAAVGPIPECLLSADPGRLAQVIDNVVANAAKYADGTLQVSARLDEPHLLVAFDDLGPGVPEDELGSVLGRGVRGSNVGDVPGEGLGLFTSAQLMERMGGSLDVANRPGRGFRVTLAIPLAGTVGLS